MSKIREVSPQLLEFLTKTDTCTVSNAIETFNVRLRDEGYVQTGIRCIFPEYPSVAGYAVPGRIRAAAPPIANLCYYHRIDWWEYVNSLPGPKILVLEDVDNVPGVGAFVGEIHTQIAKALGCVAYLSNGTVRDVPALKAAGFQCFTAGFSVSHSYAHIIEFGAPVEIGGLKIQEGDLLHGDRHGVHMIPSEIALRLPQAVADIQLREKELIEFCQTEEFSLEKLANILKEDNPRCQPPKRL